MRLETPARIGIRTRAAARAASCALTPSRSLPNASSAPCGSGPELIAAGIEHDQRPVAQPRRIGAPDRQREVQPRRAAQRRRVPRVARPGGQHGGGARSRGHAHDRADIAEPARVLEQHGGRRGRGGQHRGGIDPRASCDRGDTGVWNVRDERLERSLGDERRQLLAQVGREPLRQPPERGAVRRRRGHDLGAEAQRVLERVEALEQHQPLVRASGREGLRDGIRSHRESMAAPAPATHAARARRTLT